MPRTLPHLGTMRAHGIRQSMSARANPYHNAWTESFMGTLKAEMLQGGTFIDAHDARTELFAYIEAYYNTPQTLLPRLPNTLPIQIKSPHQ